jgi:hypothetical protein
MQHSLPAWGILEDWKEHSGNEVYEWGVRNQSECIKHKRGFSDDSDYDMGEDSGSEEEELEEDMDEGEEEDEEVR